MRFYTGVIRVTWPGRASLRELQRDQGFVTSWPSLDPDESRIEEVCGWLSWCSRTLIFIWNALPLCVLYFWLVELVSAQGCFLAANWVFCQHRQSSLCTREGKFLLLMRMPKAFARLTSHLLGDALFDTSDFQETVFCGKEGSMWVGGHLGIFFKLMEVSFQSNFKISILTCCVPYAMGIHHALETKSPLTLAKGNAIIFLIKLFSVGLFFTLSAVAHLE